MFRISKTFEFQAAHWLPNLPDDHKCARLHGHGYVTEVVLAGEVLTPPGFVVDFGELAAVKTWLEETFDHRVLNDALPPEGPAPTSENLARSIYEWVTQHLPLREGTYVERVRVSETPLTWAEYAPTRPGENGAPAGSKPPTEAAATRAEA